jgi:DNA (cytosine-5)-methyltransferase 1
VGLEIRAFLGHKHLNKSSMRRTNQPARVGYKALIPADQREAAVRLQELGGLDRVRLRQCGKDEFLRGWFALFCLFPGLHPDNARDHGAQRFEVPLSTSDLNAWPERYARSGWPVALVLIGEEAYRRHRIGELTDKEYYCSDAQMAGLRHRSSEGKKRNGVVFENLGPR